MSDGIENKTRYHTGHRQRLRGFYKEHGMDALKEYEIIEILLYSVIPIRDTQVTARGLLNRFGSLSAVFDANLDDLIKEEGIQERSALFLQAVGEACKRYAKGDKKEPIFLHSLEDAELYVKKLFENSQEAETSVLAIDSACCLLRLEKIDKEKQNSTKLLQQNLIRLIASTNASGLLLASYHPSPFTEPNESELRLTKETAETARTLNVELLDHIILSRDKTFSMANSEKPYHIFFRLS